MAGVPQPEQIVTGRLFIEPMRVETAEQIGDGIWRLGLPRHRIAVEVSVTGLPAINGKGFTGSARRNLLASLRPDSHALRIVLCH